MKKISQKIESKAESYGYPKLQAENIARARTDYARGQKPLRKAEMEDQRKRDTSAKKDAQQIVKLGKNMEKHEMYELKNAHKHKAKVAEHHKEAKHHLAKLEHHLKKMDHHHTKMEHHSKKMTRHHKAK